MLRIQFRLGWSTFSRGEAMDAKELARFRKILVLEKERILNNTRQARDELNISPDDLPDESDLAATEISQSLVFKLRDRERQLLTKINQALQRIESGEFGVCVDCEEPIELNRLKARPVSTLCLHCKEMEEHREKIYA